MSAIRKPDIGELDEIRLLEPVTLPESSDDIKHVIPAGSEGTVLLVFDGGSAFETEFYIYPNPDDPDDYISCTGPVEASQCEKVQ